MNSVILEGVNKNYKLLISYNAQVDIEELLNGESVYDLMFKPVTATNIRKVVSIGVGYGEGRKIDLKEAGAIIDDVIAKNNFSYIKDKVGLALSRAVGGDEGEVTEPRETGK